MSTTATTRRLPAELKLQGLHVSVDHRENYALNVAPMIPVVEYRPTADYGLVALPRVAAIEYKGSVADLVRSVGRDRGAFENELVRMQGFPVRALVLACTWGDIKGGNWRADVSPNSVRGSLISWSVRSAVEYAAALLNAISLTGALTSSRSIVGAKKNRLQSFRNDAAQVLMMVVGVEAPSGQLVDVHGGAKDD